MSLAITFLIKNIKYKCKNKKVYKKRTSKIQIYEV